MPSLNHDEKFARGKRWTQTTTSFFGFFGLHKKRCSVGTLHFTQCPNFLTIEMADLNVHNVKKRSTTDSKNVHKCHPRSKSFPSFFCLRLNRRKIRGAESDSGAKSTDKKHIVEETEEENVQGELETCKHFLINSEMENGRQRLSNFAVDFLNSHFLIKNFCLLIASVT